MRRFLLLFATSNELFLSWVLPKMFKIYSKLGLSLGLSNNNLVKRVEFFGFLLEISRFISLRMIPKLYKSEVLLTVPSLISGAVYFDEGGLNLTAISLLSSRLWL